jgi:hypothetical protein
VVKILIKKIPTPKLEDFEFQKKTVIPIQLRISTANIIMHTYRLAFHHVKLSELTKLPLKNKRDLNEIKKLELNISGLINARNNAIKKEEKLHKKLYDK